VKRHWKATDQSRQTLGESQQDRQICWEKVSTEDWNIERESAGQTDTLGETQQDRQIYWERVSKTDRYIGKESAGQGRYVGRESAGQTDTWRELQNLCPAIK